MSTFDEIQKEPWRFDLLALLRRLERSFPDEPRIGDSASRREEFVTLGEDPFLEFPASNISTADRDPQGRIRLLVNSSDSWGLREPSRSRRRKRPIFGI